MWELFVFLALQLSDLMNLNCLPNALLLMFQVVVADPFNNPITKGLYSEWLEQPGSEKAKRYLHTEYHPVVKSITSQLQNW
uniref:Narf n=1 Tax=Solanum tuberosum TaxID=4113 RepID=M1CE21_SOLTU